MASIDKDGYVTDLKPLNGNFALLPSVSRAVRNWHYEPTYLDSKRAETQAQIEFDLRRRRRARQPTARSDSACSEKKQKQVTWARWKSCRVRIERAGNPFRITFLRNCRHKPPLESHSCKKDTGGGFCSFSVALSSSQSLPQLRLLPLAQLSPLHSSRRNIQAI